MEEILNPKALVLGCNDIGAALENEQGFFSYCHTLNKLGFVTSSGISAEAVTSA